MLFRPGYYSNPTFGQIYTDPLIKSVVDLHTEFPIQSLKLTETRKLLGFNPHGHEIYETDEEYKQRMLKLRSEI